MNKEQKINLHRFEYTEEKVANYKGFLESVTVPGTKEKWKENKRGNGRRKERNGPLEISV